MFLQIKHLLQAQSPSSAVTTPPAASTSDAGTNTGASLCWPETPPSVHTPSSQWEEESMEPRIPDHFSVRTATTSMMSRDTATNMHLDFPSFGKQWGGGVGGREGGGIQCGVDDRLGLRSVGVGI